MVEKQKKERWYHKLRNKYRIVIFHDETFEEKITFRLSRMNVFVLTVSISVFLIFITSYIIAFTPLREYIPGYTDVNLRYQMYDLEKRADSLEQSFRQNDVYLANIRRIIEGNDLAEDSSFLVYDSSIKSNRDYSTIELEKSIEDSLLRSEFESETKFNLYTSLMPETYKHRMAVKNFFTPVKGIISNHFNPEINHFGTDIVSNNNENIKAVLDGTVIVSDWTSDKGYIIGIQHADNFFSLYKHNSTLLKKEGDFVNAGDAIAFIGETGELASGPHLHFELWYNGVPINPEEYLSFE